MTRLSKNRVRSGVYRTMPRGPKQDNKTIRVGSGMDMKAM